MGTTNVGPDRDQDTPRPESPNPENMRARESTSVALAPRPMQAMGAPAEAGGIALAAQVETHIKARYFLARQYPRSWDDVRSKLLMAFTRPMLADGAIYSKPIGGKPVQGLSIRFAEEAFRAMGNITIDTVLVSDDEDKRVYMVIGTDMETLATQQVSVVVTKQIERSSIKADSIILGERTNSKGGKTYILKATSEDDYRAKEQAQLQKARRDVILFLTPGDIQEECEARIRQTMADRDAKDPLEARRAMTAAFYKIGVTTAEIEKYLGHPIEAMNQAELDLLRKLYAGIKEGEFVWADAMDHKLGTNTGADGSAEPAPATGGAADKLKAVLAKEPPKPEVPARIQKLIENEDVPGALTDDDKEDLRQYREDHGIAEPVKGAKGKKS